MSTGLPICRIKVWHFNSKTKVSSVNKRTKNPEKNIDMRESQPEQRRRVGFMEICR